MPRLLQGHSIQPWTASAGQSSSKGCGAPEGEPESGAFGFRVPSSAPFFRV